MNWPLFFKAFLASAWAVKLKIALLLVFITALGIAVMVFEKPKYKTSWVLLLPGTERSTSLSIDNLGEARSGGTNAYGSVSISPKNTYKEIALSSAVIEKAAESYGVEAHSFSKPKIKLIDQTPAMEFALKGASPDELKYRATLYNETFHTILDQLRKNEIERNYRGVEGSLSEAKKRLRDARAAIVSYQSKSNLVSDKQFDSWLNQLEELRTAKGMVEVAHASLNVKLETQMAQIGITEQQATALLAFQGNPVNQQAVSLLSEKLAEEASLRNVFGTQNPVRKRVQQEISGIKMQIEASLMSSPLLRTFPKQKLYEMFSENAGSLLLDLNNRISELATKQANINALSEQLSKTEKRIKLHTLKAATLSDLERDHQIAEAIFSSALAKLDTSRLDIYATYPLTQLLTEPGSTIKRDRLGTKLLIIGLFLFFCLLSLGLTLTHLRSKIIHSGDALPLAENLSQNPGQNRGLL